MIMNLYDLLPIKNYVNGEFTEAASGKTLPNFEPATGQPYTTLPASDAADVAQAVNAAKRAFPAWSKLDANGRSAILRRISEGIERHLDVFAQAETMDNGKTLQTSRTVDIPRSAYNFRFFADAITQFHSESFNTNSEVINYVLHQPLGVVGCISPWNLPLYLFTWKVAPALAAGNCVVAKPSEITPLTAYLLAHVCKEAGLPPGVLNIVHGLGPQVGAALTAHPEIKAISFTGSTATGEKIASSAGSQFKKLALEMGGKNPALLFEDCDFDKTVSEMLRSGFANQGQICLCGSRILVQNSIYEKFKNAFVEKVKRLKVGDPRESATLQGAVVSEEHYKKVLSYIELAKQEGGRVLCGGRPAQVGGRCEKGWFIEPTVIEGLANTCRTNQEEIFGPVVTLIPFENEKHAVEIANQSTYGLASSIWTQNLARAHRVARDLETGIVWVNTWLNRDLRTPFGGVKSSGVGREGGMEALRFFTEPKTVCIQFEGSAT
jgi:aminomuconate-semialdehyde/2-hydroxymuconate-6-semialdehyde dehydrogenase